MRTIITESDNTIHYGVYRPFIPKTFIKIFAWDIPRRASRKPNVSH
jgi:hypothetical protein